jgi:hypothetical protein
VLELIQPVMQGTDALENQRAVGRRVTLAVARLRPLAADAAGLGALIFLAGIGHRTSVYSSGWCQAQDQCPLLRPRRTPGIRTGANGRRITPGCRHHHAQGADAGPALAAPAAARRIEIMDMKLEVADSPVADVAGAEDFYRVGA